MNLKKNYFLNNFLSDINKGINSQKKKNIKGMFGIL